MIRLTMCFNVKILCGHCALTDVLLFRFLFMLHVKPLTTAAVINILCYLTHCRRFVERRAQQSTEDVGLCLVRIENLSH